MKINTFKTIRKVLFCAVLVFSFSLSLVVSIAGTSSATVDTTKCADSGGTDQSVCPGPVTQGQIACMNGDQSQCTPSEGQVNCGGNQKCGDIVNSFVDVVNLLSAVVGIIVVGVIIFGGIQFSTSGGDPQRVAEAKKHISNAVIALVAFLLLWAFLNFIIPGGVLNGIKAGNSNTTVTGGGASGGGFSGSF